MPSVYEVITERILELLDKQVVPWRRPWAGAQNAPHNLVSGKPYRGINSFILSSAGFSSPFFLTYKQATDRGGHVRKGEKSLPVVYWKWPDKAPEGETDDGDIGQKTSQPRRGKRPFAYPLFYRVFSVLQCDNIEYPKSEAPVSQFSPIERAEQIVANMPHPPTFKYDFDKAFYSPVDDLIGLPPRERFESPESFYNVAFHEMVHASGHENRLARKGVMERTVFGDGNYSLEELIAEFGACYLSSHAGIVDTTLQNSVSYLDNWKQQLKADTRMVLRAGAAGQRAADYILGKKEEAEDDGNGALHYNSQEVQSS